MGLLRQLTILQRLILMLVLAAIGTFVFASFSINEQRNNLITQKWVQNDAQLNTVLSVIEAHRQQVNQQAINLDQAKSEVAELVNQIHSSQDGYFVLIDDNQTIIAHGANSQLIGQPASAIRSQDGRSP